MYYLVDVVLFLVTILVIFLYRFIDRRDRQIHLVKSYMDRLKQELADREQSLTSTYEQLSGEIAGREKQVRSLLGQVDDSLEDLEEHAGDLGQLQSYMSHYHRILEELSSLTEKAEQRLALLKDDFDSLQENRQQLEELSAQQQQLQETLDNLEGQIEEYRSSKVKLIDQEAGEELQRHLKKMLDKSESKFSKLSMAFERIYDNSVEAFQAQVDRLAMEAQEKIEQHLSEAIAKQTKNGGSSASGSTKRPVFFEQWGGNGINREVSSAAAVLYNAREERSNEESDEENASRDTEPENAENTQLFDMIDDDAVDNDGESEHPVESVMQHLEENEDGGEAESHTPLDEAEEHEELQDEPAQGNIEEEEPAPDEQEAASEVFDDEEFDRIYYEDEEEIVLDDTDDSDDSDTDDDREPVVSPEKRKIVEEHLREGFSSSEIEELTEIPKGEVELIRELLGFSDKEA